MDPTLETMSEIFKGGVKELVSRKEVMEMFSSLLEVVKELRDSRDNLLEDAQKKIEQSFSDHADTLLSESKLSKKELEDSFSALESRLSANLDELRSRKVDFAPLETALRSEMESLRERIDEVDEKETPESVSLEDVENNLPMFGEKYRDALELLKDDERLDKKAVKGIEDIEKQLDELKKQKGGKIIVGGSNAMSPAHWPIHENFTMNGSDTSVTLQAGVGAGGNALIVRYNGGTLDMTTHYTVSGNKVSFTFTPETSQVISITYWP